MSLRYPPLANGTYRVGDTPQPLPSPIPGPDPSVPTAQSGYSHPTGPPQVPKYGAQFHGPQFDAQQPHPPMEPYPAGASQGSRSRPRAGFFALGFALVLLVVLAAGAMLSGSRNTPLPQATPPLTDQRGSSPQAGGTLTVSGVLEVSSSRGDTVTGTPTECQLPPSLSDLGPHTVVQLFGAQRVALGTTLLSYQTGGPDQCVFIFEFMNIPQGEVAYYLEIPGRGRVDYSESDLRRGLYISLGG